MEILWPGRAQETRQHWFTFGDCCVAVSESFGNAANSRALLFLHGRYGDSEVWRPLAAKLAPHFRCLLLDLPGFGHSFALHDRGLSLIEQSRLVQAVLERFSKGGQGAVIIGHDLGGAIAQLCAIQAPRLVSALVLINSAVLTREAPFLDPGWQCLRARRRLVRLLARSQDRIGSGYRASLVSAWRGRAKRAALHRVLSAWAAAWPGPIERQVWKRHLRELPQPVLILWGRRDAISPFENAVELLRRVPDAYLFELEDGGHWPYLESTEWVDHKMREFLFRVAGDETRSGGARA